MPVLAAVVADPEVLFEDRPVFNGVFPCELDALAVVGVYRGQPAFGEVLLYRLAGEGAPFRTVFVDSAVAGGGPDNLVARLHQAR